MNLEQVASKLAVMAKRIKAENGPLDLLGLFLREDSAGLWDVVIAAPWLKSDELASFELVAGQLQESLENDELAQISRIVILDHGGMILQHFLDQYRGQTGLADVHYSADGGAVIRKIFLVEARPVTSRRKAKKSGPAKATPPKSPPPSLALPQG